MKEHEPNQQGLQLSSLEKKVFVETPLAFSDQISHVRAAIRSKKYNKDLAPRDRTSPLGGCHVDLMHRNPSRCLTCHLFFYPLIDSSSHSLHRHTPQFIFIIVLSLSLLLPYLPVHLQTEQVSNIHIYFECTHLATRGV